VRDRTGQQLRVGDDASFRTFKQQDDDYAKGRTMPGKRVTNASGGQSYHNYGLGFDIAGLKTNGQDVTYELSYPTIGQIAQEHGFEWGGNWSTPDRPHFQRTYGYSTNQLQQMVGPDSKFPVIPADRMRGKP
jgi:peptidoglycan L-alanyl-D-glutamate endopeptidase CwlK